MYAICPKNLRFLVKKAKFTKLNFSQGGSAEISLILDSYQPNGILTGSIFTFFGSFQKSFFLLRDSVLGQKTTKVLQKLSYVRKSGFRIRIKNVRIRIQIQVSANMLIRIRTQAITAFNFRNISKLDY